MDQVNEEPVTYTFAIDAGSETSEIYFSKDGSDDNKLVNKGHEPFYLYIIGNNFSSANIITQPIAERYSNIKFLNALDYRKSLFGGQLNSFESLILSIRLNVIDKLRGGELGEAADRIEKGDPKVTLKFKFLAGISIKEKIKFIKAIEMAFPGCKVEDTQIIDEATTQAVDYQHLVNDTPDKYYLITYDMGGSTIFLNLSLVDKTEKKPKITNITHMTPIGGKKIDKDLYIYFLDMYFPILYTTKNELKEELDGINKDNYIESEIIKLFIKNYKSRALEKGQGKIKLNFILNLLKKFLEDENSLADQEKIYSPVIAQTLKTLQNKKIEDYINSFNSLSGKLNIDPLRLIELGKDNKLSEIEYMKEFEEVKEEHKKVKKILEVNKDEKYKSEFKEAQNKYTFEEEFTSAIKKYKESITDKTKEIQLEDNRFIADSEKFEKLFLIGSKIVAPLPIFYHFITYNTNKYFLEELKNGARYLKSQLKEECPIYLTWSGGNAIQKAGLKEVIKKEIPNIEEIGGQILHPFEAQAEGGIYMDEFNIEYVATGCQPQIVVCNDKILDVTYGKKINFKQGERIEIFESTPKVSNDGSVNRIKQTLVNNPTFIRRDDKFLADVDEEIRKTEQGKIPGKKELLEEYKKRFIEVNEKIKNANKELENTEIELRGEMDAYKKLEECQEKIGKQHQNCLEEIREITKKINLIKNLEEEQNNPQSELESIPNLKNKLKREQKKLAAKKIEVGNIKSEFEKLSQELEEKEKELKELKNKLEKFNNLKKEKQLIILKIKMVLGKVKKIYNGTPEYILFKSNSSDPCMIVKDSSEEKKLTNDNEIFGDGELLEESTKKIKTVIDINKISNLCPELSNKLQEIYYFVRRYFVRKKIKFNKAKTKKLEKALEISSSIIDFKEDNIFVNHSITKFIINFFECSNFGKFLKEVNTKNSNIEDLNLVLEVLINFYDEIKSEKKYDQNSLEISDLKTLLSSIDKSFNDIKNEYKTEYNIDIEFEKLKKEREELYKKQKEREETSKKIEDELKQEQLNIIEENVKYLSYKEGIMLQDESSCTRRVTPTSPSKKPIRMPVGQQSSNPRKRRGVTFVETTSKNDSQNTRKVDNFNKIRQRSPLLKEDIESKNTDDSSSSEEYLESNFDVAIPSSIPLKQDEFAISTVEQNHHKQPEQSKQKVSSFANAGKNILSSSRLTQNPQKAEKELTEEQKRLEELRKRRKELFQRYISPAKSKGNFQ